MSQKLELFITGVASVALVLLIGALKVQGIVDAEYATLATGLVVGGGLGWGGKTAASAPSEKPPG